MPTRIYAVVHLQFVVRGVCRDVKLVRYPHYNQGRIVFTYLGDIWTADENGQTSNE